MIQFIGLALIIGFVVYCIWIVFRGDWIMCMECKTKNPIEYEYSSSVKGTCSKCGKTLRASTW